MFTSFLPDGSDVIFTVIYFFITACIVAPPTEFVSAGLTVQNLMSSRLGSEELNFIYYHIRRTTATILLHSFIPIGYFIGMVVHRPDFYLLQTIWNNSAMVWWTPLWRLYFAASLLLPSIILILAFYWYQKKWNNHPIAKNLNYLESGSSWRAVASSIDIEFRRIDKFTSGVPGKMVYVTDSWVLKTTAYFVHVAHQNDIHLTLSGSEEHSIAYSQSGGAQYLNISVASINEHVKPFLIRLNSLEYSDLRLKLSTPVRNARNVVIQQSLSDRFLDTFREQINRNPVFRPTPNMEIETCIGCMQKLADVKLQKYCDEPNSGECVQCYCRPMWCLECLGKWFASRQNQDQPETWLSSRSPCPTCRALFCMLDISRIVDS